MSIFCPVCMREREKGKVCVWRGEMAPFPDEVDVFTGPHWRMKQLVGLYCDKVGFISLNPLRVDYTH